MNHIHFGELSFPPRSTNFSPATPSFDYVRMGKMGIWGYMPNLQMLELFILFLKKTVRFQPHPWNQQQDLRHRSAWIHSFFGKFFEVADVSPYTDCHRWYLKAGPKHSFFQGLPAWFRADFLQPKQFGREKYIGPENSDGCGKTYLQTAREVTYVL